MTEKKNEIEKDEFDQILRTCLLEEINYRMVIKRDKHALEILSAAKQRVKENIDAIKWMLIAMKPFYLMAVIALMSQKPESI